MILHILGSKGAFPPPDDGTSAYLIENDGRFILLDCGSGAITGLQRFCRIEQLSAVVLSHLHFDHCAELPLIGYALKSMGRSLPLFMPSVPQDMFLVMDAPEFETHPVDGPFECAGLKFGVLPSVHPCPGYSYAISDGDKKFVYTGDTAWHDGLAAFCSGAELILADANLTEAKRIPKMAHMTALETARLACAAGAKKLVLTHTPPLGPTDAIAAEARSIFPDASVAARGQSYNI